MRLFIAVNFSDDIKNLIMEAEENLRSQSLRGSFTRKENLHLTLAFLGETPEDRLSCLCGLMEKIRAPGFEVVFKHTGCFTHSHKELWWIGAEPDCPGLRQLRDLHTRLNSLLLEAGFPVDTRPFNAHISLGREIKHNGEIILVSPEIVVPVNRISLMKSEHIKGVLTYTELFSVEAEG